MGNRVTHFQRAQLDRAVRFVDANGWELLREVENTEERNCNGVPVDVFFPTADEYSPVSRGSNERARIAKECRGCPVADECLAGALLRGERYGSWGGVAQPDFQALGRIWRREHAPSSAGAGVDRSGCAAKRHGDRSAYSDGCRCADAREDHRRYQRDRAARQRASRPEVA